VEVVHADYSEPYEGDALNVGTGGLSLRAPYLPEVGAQLSCRFISPVDGAVVETRGEVVWTEDRGPHIGEFGVRFLEVEEPSRRAITGMVRAWGDMMTDHDLDVCAEHELPPSDGTLHVEGVASPIQTTVVHDSIESSILEQELPFLQLGRAVSMNDGRRHGILSSVSLHTEGDLPRLVLGIEWEPQYEAEAVHRKEDTLHDFEAPSFEEDPLAAVAPSLEDDFDDMGILVGDVAVDATRADETKLDFDDELAEVEAQLKPSIKHRLQGLMLWGRTMLAGLWAFISRLRGGVAPIKARVTREFPVAFGHAKVWLRKTFSPVWAFARTSVNAIRIRLGMTAIGHGRGRKRRRTSPPPRGRVEQLTPRRRQGGERAQAAPRRRRKLPVGPAVVVLLAVGLGAYALSPAEGEAADTESGFEEDGVLEGVAAPTRGTRRIAAPVAALPAPEPEVEAAPEPEEVQAEETVTPRMPTALPEPSRQAGPLGQEPGEGSVDTAEAEPEVAAPAGREFGSANVPDGRVFRLRMSLPIESFQGTTTANGFEVTIPESLSLDRAGPIAAAHPDVERAMVLNRGDHAELSIRFVDGRSPAFRVRARGATLEITIGR